jgi:hypothetical protein
MLRNNMNTQNQQNNSIDDLVKQGFEKTRYTIMGMDIYCRGDDRLYYNPRTNEMVFKYDLSFKNIA